MVFGISLSWQGVVRECGVVLPSYRQQWWPNGEILWPEDTLQKGAASPAKQSKVHPRN